MEWDEQLEECATDAIGAIDDFMGDFPRNFSIEEEYEVKRRIIQYLTDELNQYQNG